MINSKGVCSVTFRALPIKEVTQLAKENGLESIEWGGDIHVPTNDLANAEHVKRLTEENGLRIFSYGSYFRCDGVVGFEEVSLTAEKLGAKVIRVWAGNKDADDCTEEDFTTLVKTAQNCADIAKKKNQTIAFEYHYNTYNKNAEYALKLLNAINKNNVKTYWQPMYWYDYDNERDELNANINSIKKLGTNIVCVHVYNWKGTERLSLTSGTDKWKAYNKALPDVCAYLEFVKDDSEKQFKEDCCCFKSKVI